MTVDEARITINSICEKITEFIPDAAIHVGITWEEAKVTKYVTAGVGNAFAREMLFHKIQEDLEAMNSTTYYEIETGEDDDDET